MCNTTAHCDHPTVLQWHARVNVNRGIHGGVSPVALLLFVRLPLWHCMFTHPNTACCFRWCCRRLRVDLSLPIVRSEVVAWCLASCSAASVALAALWGQQRRRQLQPRLAGFYSALLQQLGLGAAEAGADPEAAVLGSGFGLGTGHACSGSQTEQVGGTRGQHPGVRLCVIGHWSCGGFETLQHWLCCALAAFISAVLCWGIDLCVTISSWRCIIVLMVETKQSGLVVTFFITALRNSCSCSGRRW